MINFGWDSAACIHVLFFNGAEFLDMTKAFYNANYDNTLEE